MPPEMVMDFLPGVTDNVAKSHQQSEDKSYVLAYQQNCIQMEQIKKDQEYNKTLQFLLKKAFSN